jgi:Flp pilus assembly protein protease CpaA
MRPSMAPGRRCAWLAGLALPALVGPVWVLALDHSPRSLPATWTGMVVVALVVTCACTDLIWRKIPNWATYPAVLWALGINAVGTLRGEPPVEGMGETVAVGPLGYVGFGRCLLGLAACFGVMFLVYRLSRGGAGDVKLAAALGALLGPERGFFALLCTFIVAGVVVAAWVVWTVGPLVLVKALGRLVGSFLLPWHVAPPSVEQRGLLRSPVPLGLFFAIGALTILSGVEPVW